MPSKQSVFIATLILTIAALHYSTPVHLHQLHELYRVFFYLPIILAAFSYRLTGGITAAASVIIIYFPHVVFQWGGDFWYNFPRFLEMVMYLVIGIITGILVQRQKNEQLRYQTTAEKLERSFARLKQQSEKLTEMEEQLRNSERLAVVGELSASLAHEVRNPLGSIWGVVEILRDEFRCQPNTAEFIDILLKEVKRLNGVVENYLNLSRKTPVERQTCHLQLLVQSVIDLLTRQAQKHRVRWKVQMPTEPLFIQANEVQLRQILINLILNAIAAMPNGGEVTLTAGNASTEPDAAEIWIEVSDNGVGIAPEHLEKIFKPFFTTTKQGTGLGLSIVKRIIDENKWKIKIESTLNQGTRVRIYF